MLLLAYGTRAQACSFVHIEKKDSSHIRGEYLRFRKALDGGNKEDSCFNKCLLAKAKQVMTDAAKAKKPSS